MPNARRSMGLGSAFRAPGVKKKAAVSAVTAGHGSGTGAPQGEQLVGGRLGVTLCHPEARLALLLGADGSTEELFAQLARSVGEQEFKR